MNKIYNDEAVADERIDLIEINENKDGDDSGPSYGKLCCGEQYQRATLIGCLISVFS